eukprot:TRINITY_DN2082_c0_g1_i5.p1 TRINITY_DN2082_c0_g1~~TRINITY_DN2082_c0_g1_i5.p1  ORF type:complete len:497 (-),score=140.95 TRINITY_DN2082_c0_g1_i5:334-1776(-)
MDLFADDDEPQEHSSEGSQEGLNVVAAKTNRWVVEGIRPEEIRSRERNTANHLELAPYRLSEDGTTVVLEAEYLEQSNEITLGSVLKKALKSGISIRCDATVYNSNRLKHKKKEMADEDGDGDGDGDDKNGEDKNGDSREEEKQKKKEKEEQERRDRIILSHAGIAYRAFHEQYTYDRYCGHEHLFKFLPPHQVYRLSLNEIKRLCEYSLRFVASGRPPTNREAGEDFAKLFAFFDRVLEHFRTSSTPSPSTSTSSSSSPTALFVRLNTTSGKNDRSPVPLTNAHDCVRHLINSRLMLKEYELWLSNNDSSDNSFSLAVIAIPWNYKLDASKEWRAIVLNGSLRAISQQRWYEPVGITSDMALRAATLIEELVREIMGSSDESSLGDYHERSDNSNSNKKRTTTFSSSSISSPHLPFTSCVLDVWIDDETGVARLIECNPGNDWGCSGSSLFHWIDDHQVLQSLDYRGPKIARFVSSASD